MYLCSVIVCYKRITYEILHTVGHISVRYVIHRLLAKKYIYTHVMVQISHDIT